MAGQKGRPAGLTDLIQQTDAVLEAATKGMQTIVADMNVSTVPLATSEIGPGYGDETTMSRAANASILRNDYIGAGAKQSSYDALRHVFGKVHTTSAVAYADGQRITIPAAVRDVPNALESDKHGLIMARRLLKALMGEALFSRARYCARGRGFKTQVGTKTTLWLSQQIVYLIHTRAKFDLGKHIETFDKEIDNNTESLVVKAIVMLFGQGTYDELLQLAHLNQCSLRQLLVILTKMACDRDDEIRYSKIFDADADSIDINENNPGNE
jgi:hypothetical protein